MKRIRKFISMMMDHAVPLQDRMFILVNLLTAIAVFVVMVGDIIIGEDKREIIGLALALVFAPLVAVISARIGKKNAGIVVQVLFIIFGVMPLTFFYGGGFYGGSAIWFS
ncbi:MAG: hypothetical protein J6X66_12420, partial [Lachnospiraceae bacterium]|nr:hypothetical protein [Lachnospiraceae bacterium]